MIKKSLNFFKDDNIAFKSKKFKIYRNITAGGPSYKIKQKMNLFKWEWVSSNSKTRTFVTISEAEKWMNN